MAFDEGFAYDLGFCPGAGGEYACCMVSSFVRCRGSPSNAFLLLSNSFHQAVMCLLVTRSPGSQFTNPALDELEYLVEFFEAAASRCRAARDVLVRVRL